jgi:hypothetical protein
MWHSEVEYTDEFENWWSALTEAEQESITIEKQSNRGR